MISPQRHRDRRDNSHLVSGDGPAPSPCPLCLGGEDLCKTNPIWPGRGRTKAPVGERCETNPISGSWPTSGLPIIPIFHHSTIPIRCQSCKTKAIWPPPPPAMTGRMTVSSHLRWSRLYWVATGNRRPQWKGVDYDQDRISTKPQGENDLSRTHLCLGSGLGTRCRPGGTEELSPGQPGGCASLAGAQIRAICALGTGQSQGHRDRLVTRRRATR